MFLHLVRDRATVYLDVGGGSLHERGWRGRGGEAPLRETLAASIVRLSGWDRETPLLDPMCGAGRSRSKPPRGHKDEPRGCRVRDWAASAGRVRTLNSARALGSSGKVHARRRETSGPTVIARDVDPLAVERTRANARAAGVEIRAEVADIRSMKPDSRPAFVVSNPPYGERLDSSPDLYPAIAHALERCPRTTVALLAGNAAIGNAWSRRPDRFWVLFNGAIECRLLVFAPREGIWPRDPSRE